MGAFSRATDQASSAAQSAALADGLNDRGSTIPGVSETALKDALKELGDALTSIQDAEPKNSEEMRIQWQAAEKIRAAEDAVLQAQQESPDSAEAAVDLRAAADDLSALGSTLKQFQ